MSKINLLVITEKWIDGLEERGPSCSQHNINSTLEISDLVDPMYLYFDEIYKKNYRKVDDTIIDHLDTSEKPDAVLVQLIYNHHTNPTNRLFEEIKDRGIPLLFSWPDSRGPWVKEKIKELRRLANQTKRFSKAELEEVIKTYQV